MNRRQFRVLYRDFLFSVVDRELLSTYGTGDASRLLLQFVTLLFCLGVIFCLSVFAIGVQQTAMGRLVSGWTIEHFLIATTMLVVGVFAVLSWDRLFPSQRDVLVLGPLPIQAHTILAAKFCAIATALGVAVIALHAAAGVIVPLALNRLSPDRALHARPFTYDPAMPPVPATELQSVLDRDLAALLRDGPLAPGAGGAVAIGIYQRGVRRVFAYGAAAPDSIFQIASASKPFAGVLLADMAERGMVRLDEPVRRLIPAAGLSRPAGDDITLLDLVTHRSSLPAIPANYRPVDPANPAADFHVSELYAYLRTRGVHRRPRASFLYSNLGFGLLGHALSQRAGVDYETLLRQTITGPLGMPDTVVNLSPEQQRRFLQGYNDFREPIPAWDFDALAPAGGLRSTAPDMLGWLEANLHPERVRITTLAAALRASHQVHARVNADTDIALAWMFHPDSGDYEHAGGVGGFTVDAFFNPAKDMAAVVLSNVGPAEAVWSADVLGERVRARLSGQRVESLADLAIPPTGGVGTWIRLMIAYWVTMAAAGLFVFGLAASVQGLVAACLPRRIFLRVSSSLQLAMFGLVVGTYVLQPMVARPDVLLAAQSGGLVAWSPSLWFLGLFQALGGSPALAVLARHAVIGLGVIVLGTAAAYGLSYVRTLRQIAEQPDFVAPAARSRGLPAFGASPRAAIAHFGLETVFRSAPHRVILAFYWGLGFALTLFVLKIPRGQQLAEGPVTAAWDETGVPLVVSSVVMMAFAALAARLAFAMPRDLQANWIFRALPLRSASEYMAARRRALVLVSVVPVWTGWAVALFSLWPWQPALGHLLALGCFGLILVELALIGPLKIPCTCSYLPGKSQMHLAFCVLVLLFIGLVRRGARVELEALQDPVQYALIVGALGAIWIGLRWFTAATHGSVPIFDEEGSGEAVSLRLSDSRIIPEARAMAGREAPVAPKNV